MPVYSLPLPELRARLDTQVDFLQPAFEHRRNRHGSLMSVFSARGARFARDANDGSWQSARGAAGGAGAEDVGAAHNPT